MHGDFQHPPEDLLCLAFAVSLMLSGSSFGIHVFLCRTLHPDTLQRAVAVRHFTCLYPRRYFPSQEQELKHVLHSARSMRRIRTASTPYSASPPMMTGLAGQGPSQVAHLDTIEDASLLTSAKHIHTCMRPPTRLLLPLTTPASADSYPLPCLFPSTWLLMSTQVTPGLTLDQQAGPTAPPHPFVGSRTHRPETHLNHCHCRTSSDVTKAPHQVTPEV